MATGGSPGKDLLKKIAVGLSVGGGLALVSYGAYRLSARRSRRELPPVVEQWMLDWVKDLEAQGVR
jgi:hypothetical protein